MIKSKPCKYCKSTFHTAYKCQNNPKNIGKYSSITNKKSDKDKSKNKKAKPKTETRSKIIKKLDAIFSKYVRLYYSDNYGNVACYTCDSKMHWKSSQNGHFFSRVHHSTRWDIDNCRVQDYRCNVALNGNYIVYTRRMIKEVGMEKVDELERKSRSNIKISTIELREMIEYYTKEVGKLLTLKAS